MSMGGAETKLRCVMAKSGEGYDAFWANYDAIAAVRKATPF